MTAVKGIGPHLGNGEHYDILICETTPCPDIAGSLRLQINAGKNNGYSEKKQTILHDMAVGRDLTTRKENQYFSQDDTILCGLMMRG
jgi:hypothetical protein